MALKDRMKNNQMLIFMAQIVLIAHMIQEVEEKIIDLI